MAAIEHGPSQHEIRTILLIEAESTQILLTRSGFAESVASPPSRLRRFGETASACHCVSRAL